MQKNLVLLHKNLVYLIKPSLIAYKLGFIDKTKFLSKETWFLWITGHVTA
jgi:hypothetical protein